MIAIIGGSGFVGSAFVRLCERKKIEHVVITRENYSQYVGASCDILINANGSSSKVLAERDPSQDFDLAVRSVRNSLIDFRFGLYVHLSSCDVYPDCSDPAATVEECLIEPQRQSRYGFHRSLAEACVRHAADHWLIFRMGGFTGPGLRKNAIYDILFGEKLWLDPASELQFIATDAAADIVMTLVERGVKGECFNLCGHGTVSLEEVAAMAKRYPPVAPGAPRVKYQVSIDKLERFVPVPHTRDAAQSFVRQVLEISNSSRSG